MGRRDDGDDERYGDGDELPRHQVMLSAYLIAKYEVTNAQYAEVLNWALRQGHLENSSGGSHTYGDVYTGGKVLVDVGGLYGQISCKGGGFAVASRNGYSMETHPAVVVSWYGSVAFCNWLSEKEGLTPAYDLSTWELVDADSGAGGFNSRTAIVCRRKRSGSARRLGTAASTGSTVSGATR